MSYLSDFAETIQENKHLYTEEEQIELMLIWEKEYQEYLLKKYYKDQLRKQREVGNYYSIQLSF